MILTTPRGEPLSLRDSSAAAKMFVRLRETGEVTHVWLMNNGIPAMAARRVVLVLRRHGYRINSTTDAYRWEVI